MAAQRPYPHRIKQSENSILAAKLGAMYPGDIIVKQGTSHIVCDPCAASINMESAKQNNKVLICNLTNGRTSFCDADEEVWPCLDVTLGYRTLRRG